MDYNDLKRENDRLFKDLKVINKKLTKMID